MVRFAELRNYYELEKTIGCGGFAKVKSATHLMTGEKVAIKIMSKSELGNDLPRVKLEVQALKELQHQHICKLYQILETADNYYLVMEYCSGGELFDHIIERSRLSEQESRGFFRQIVSAVAFLHSNGYAHRDLKPENVLLDSNQNLKLIDFGLCAQPKGGMGNILLTACGSPSYAAPELVMAKEYLGSEVDVWAMGVLLFVLLSGYLPFDDLNITALYDKIKKGSYNEPYWMSKSSKDLIRSMLQVDPKKRIQIYELLKHPWVTDGESLQSISFRSRESRTNLDDECVEIMARFRNENVTELKKRLQKWTYDYETATYLLLKQKKQTGQKPLQLYARHFNQIPVSLSETPKTFRKRIDFNIDDHLQKLKCPTAAVNKSVLCEKNQNVTRIIGGANNTTSSPLRKLINHKKRVRDFDESPMPDECPAKISRPDPETPKSNKNMSFTVSTPKSTSKTKSNIMFETLEKSFSHVRQILTPNKRAASASTATVSGAANGEPHKLQILTEKNLLNVSSTTYTDPETLIVTLMKMFESKQIECKRKGFRIRGKVNDRTNPAICGSCSFELEICSIPNFNRIQPRTPNLIEGNDENAQQRLGIRRKRLRGNAWSYKKVCEQILTLTTCEPLTSFETCV